MKKLPTLLLSQDVLLDTNPKQPRFDMQKVRAEAAAADPGTDWEILLVNGEVFPTLVKSEGGKTPALRPAAIYRNRYDGASPVTPDMRTNSVEFDYDTHITSDHDSCEKEGICRCSVIDVNGINEISGHELARELAAISNHFGHEAFSVALATLVNECIENNGGVKLLDIAANVVGGYYGEELEGSYMGNQLAHEFLECLHRVEAVPLEFLENVFRRHSELVAVRLELPKSASRSTRVGGRYSLVQAEFDTRYPGLRLFTYPDIMAAHVLFGVSCKIQDQPFLDWLESKTSVIPSSVELPQFLVKPNDLSREMLDTIKASQTTMNGLSLEAWIDLLG